MTDAETPVGATSGGGPATNVAQPPLVCVDSLGGVVKVDVAEIV